jgi:hypothetical protein
MMRFNLRLPFACMSAILASGTLAAQDQGSTLIRLSERSTAIVQARALSTRVVGTQQRVDFKVQRALKGRLSGSFTLTETAGRACGHALHGTLVGSSYLVFLDESAGKVRLTVGSSRAMVRVDPDILGHVRALLNARSTLERLSLLTANLRSRNDRVRRDAAIALPIRKGLELATQADRDRIIQALQSTLGQDDRAALGLIQTVSRLRLRSAVPTLLQDYMADRNSSLRRIYLQVIPELDAAYAVDQIERGMPRGVKGQTRTIAMLSRCPGHHATDCLKRFARSRNQAVSSLATEAISAQATAGREAIVVPAHKFRSINPQSRR